MPENFDPFGIPPIPDAFYGQRSEVLRNSLNFLDAAAPGCVFYVTRNGWPFADGSFGMASLDTPGPGGTEMTIDSIVHVGSVGKFFCIIAILRLMQEWNAIKLAVMPNGIKTDEQFFTDTVKGYDHYLNTRSPAYPLLIDMWLDRFLINQYRFQLPSYPYPGKNIRDITIGELIMHTSGVSYNIDEKDLGGWQWDNVNKEWPNDSLVRQNLPVMVTALLKQDGMFPRGANNYSNEGYWVLGAIIEAVTGKTYDNWLRERIFRNVPEYDVLNRFVAAGGTKTKYYNKVITDSGGEFTYHFEGNLHPDYSGFNASGGWYVTARIFCDWLYKIMTKQPIDNKPASQLINAAYDPNVGGAVLENPEILFDFTTDIEGRTVGWGVSAEGIGDYTGFGKNGGARPGGNGAGATNSKMVYLRNAAGDQLCAFTELNGEYSADAIMNIGLEALKAYL